MLTGPVFRFELARVSRKPQFYGARALYTFFALVTLGICYYTFWAINEDDARSKVSIGQMARFGQSMFSTLALCQFVAACALTPALVALLIAEEKQRKTLGCLLATPLASREIIFGKLGVRLLQVAVCFLLGLPIFILLGLFGGVDPAFAILADVGTATTVFFLAAIAMLVSVYAKRTREAVSAAYAMAFFWWLMPMLAGAIAGRYWPRLYGWLLPVTEWIDATNPLSLLFSGLLGRPGLLERGLWMMALQTAYGALLLAFAVWRLRPVYRKQQDQRSRWAWLRRFRRVKLGRRPACFEADPMFWKERYVADHHSVARLLGFLFCAGTIGYGAYEWWTTAAAAPGNASAVTSAMMAFYLKIASVLVYILTALGMAVCAADSIASEREQDTWLGLLATPLEGSEILRAKMLAALWKFRFMLGLLVIAWLLGLLTGVLHPLGFVLGIIELAIFLWFTVALGAYHSLKAASASKAQGATIGTLMLLNNGLFCCAQFATVTYLGSMGCTPLLLGGSLVASSDLVKFATYSMNLGGNSWLVVIAAAGVVGYALGAWCYTWALFRLFDEYAGRPRRLEFPSLPVFAANAPERARRAT